jgi:hypothetical protein
MHSKYENVQWVVQQNLTAPAEFEDLRKACGQIGIRFIGLDIIPFSSSLPAFDRSRHSIVYGSTTFNKLASEDAQLSKSVFFDEQAFSMANYMEQWGQYMLNYGATVTSFQDLINHGQYGADELLFIRPDNDSKSFAGEVKRFAEIGQWYEQLRQVANTDLSPSSHILVAKPYNIQYEWRLWIVNKKVIAASRYREYFRLSKQEGCPNEVVAFAEERCGEYVPHDVFVMDVCLCGDSYFIVECGCVNGTGFYKANIEKIVRGITEYVVDSLA